VVALLLLALLGLAAMVPVRADDDGSDGGSGGGSGGDSGDGGEQAPAPPKKSKAAAKPKAPKVTPPAPSASDIALSAISKLPVEPLAMDAAALKDDDRQFDMLPKTLTGMENVEALTAALTKATTLLHKMQRDVESEKTWTKNVYDIIQNYQYKYVKTVKDVKEREQKVGKLAAFVKLIKQSTLHASIQNELSKASKQLSELVTRTGGSKDEMGRYYQTVQERMNSLKAQLTTLPRPGELHSETIAKMKSILKQKIPPKSSDALSNLVNGEPTEAAKPKPQPAKPKPQSKPKAPKKAAPKKSGKKANRTKKSKKGGR